VTTVDSSVMEVVVGLEVHVELQTATKLFCGCANRFGAPPNTNVCPVCLGLPGSLPVLNRQAVEFAMRIGEALHCTVQPSIFHRKNYFYPDMPKDYQTSQYDLPINADGWLDLPDGSRVGVTRAHMEEDTGKTSHVGSTGRIHGADHALVDYNRAGVPLVEIVSEPDIRSAAQAQLYVRELRAVLLAIGVSDARMEEGSMRVDANVSVRRGPAAPLGTRCEIKNLNSIRSLGRAIEYEASRQAGIDVVVQETRHWVEDEGRTVAGRSKEEANDYRYFPEPDLVPVAPSASWLASVRSALPPLPAQRRARLASAVGDGAGDVALVVEKGLDDLVLAAVVDHGADPRLALTHAEHNLHPPSSLDPARFAALVSMQASGRLTATQAKAVLAELESAPPGGPPPPSPEEVAAALGFEALPADDLAAAVDAAIAAHRPDFDSFAGGNAKAAGPLVAAVMKATNGRANGKEVTALLRQRAGLS
jgi:aspartyl-tRNA(Asn)/glutamyl-tRNA(Gln) amidotransferase subunit B